MSLILSFCFFIAFSGHALNETIPGNADRIDYPQIFGDKYTEAENYLINQHWISDSLIANGLSPDFAKAIVFPEVIRYSVIKDKLELQGLFTLYVQYGERYSDFSVGHFQMKPSFAWQLERDVLNCNSRYKSRDIIDTADTPAARLARVKRLNSAIWQVQYLVWFVQIMDQRYGSDFNNDLCCKLRFYAAAYNVGYNKPEEAIRKAMKRNTFHTALFSGYNFFNYSDIAAYFLNGC